MTGVQVFLNGLTEAVVRRGVEAADIVDSDLFHCFSGPTGTSMKGKGMLARKYLAGRTDVKRAGLLGCLWY